MSAIYEIPLTPEAQRFTINLNGAPYNMRLTYDEAQDGCWMLDIGDTNQVPLVAGMPLVTGVDLFAQYAYLNFGGSLVVTTDAGAGEAPTFSGLGLTSHLYFIAK